MQSEHDCIGVNKSSLVHELRVARSTLVYIYMCMHCILHRIICMQAALEKVAVCFKGNFHGPCVQNIVPAHIFLRAGIFLQEYEKAGIPTKAGSLAPLLYVCSWLSQGTN